MSVPPEEPLLSITTPRLIPNTTPPTKQPDTGSSISGVSRKGITRYQNANANTPTTVRTQNCQPTVIIATTSSKMLMVSELSHIGTAPPYSGKSVGKAPCVA